MTTQRTSVQSSNIRSIGYDPERFLLDVEFTSGAVYRYADVPAHAHRALMAAESKGRHFAVFVRGRYTTVRLTTPQMSSTEGAAHNDH